MTKNEALAKYFDSLSPAMRRAKSRDIKESCHISTRVLYYWREGYTRIPPLCADKIVEILGTNIFRGVEK